MASLEHRIVDLEAALPPRRDPIVIFIDGVPARDGRPIPRGEIIGIKDLAKRQPGEAEQEFLDRAVVLACANARPNETALLLFIERSIGEEHSDDA